MSDPTTLKDHLLIATPAMDGTCFERAVVYMCEHSTKGAMGLIINHPHESFSYHDISTQLSLTFQLPATEQPTIYTGGPVDSSKGFVLHSSDYVTNAALISPHVALSSSLAILEHIARSEGPSYALIALGYTGWGEGQIEEELKGDSWLVAQSDPDLLFHTECENRWKKAASYVGIKDITSFFPSAGNA